MSNSLKKTLLLVEDDAILALTEKLELEKYGYEVRTVNTGEKAIQAVETSSDIDLILMDINLGNGIDGTEAAEIILRDHDIPIVFVSSHSEREVVEKTEKITSYGYVVKNSSITVLDASIKMAFKLFDAKIRELKKEEDLRESEKRIQKKLNALTTFETNISDLELADIIDVDTIQSLMDDFYEFTRFPVAIIDLTGKVIVQTGWQDICTKFHRMHPETLKNCIECDTILTKNVPAGEFKSYLCKNNLWDNVTPLIIGNNHVGNLFTGQFFYEGEKPDDSVFISQAEKYGFDKEDYMDAMHRVPIWKREVATIGLRFYAKLAHTISALSHVNICLYKTIGEHKAVEESLRESEMRLKAVVENNPSLTTITNAEGQLEFVSPQCEKVIGWLVEDIIGLTMPDFIHPDDKNSVFADHAKVMALQSISEIEYRIYDKQNNVRWISHSASCIKIGDTNLIVSSISNITQRKKAEEALRESEERFVLAMNASNDGLFDWNLETNNIYYSPRWKSILGYEDHEIANDFSFWETATEPEDVKRSWELQQKLITGQIDRFFIEFKMKHKHGHLVDILSQAKAVFDKNGKAKRMVGTHTDITDRKGAEEALRESEEKYRLLFLNMNSYNSLYDVVTDKEGKVCDFRFIMVNSAYEKYVGKSAHELVGKTLLEIYPATEQYWIDKMAEVASTGTPNQFENFSKVMNTHTEINLFVPKKGQLAMTTGNIDKRKHIEGALRENKQKAELLLNVAAEIIISLDSQGNITLLNESGHRILGYESPELVGKNWFDTCLPVEDRVEIKIFFHQLMDGMTNLLVTHVNDVVAKNGERKTILWHNSLLKDKDEKGIGLFSSGEDITDRKKLVEALRENEAKFRAMVETFPLAIHQTVGVEQITEYVNPTMVKLFGYTQADIPSVAQWWPLAYPDETYRRQIAEEWTERVKHAIATQSPIEPMEVVCTCKDGSKKNISWGYITLGDKNYSCGLDITKRKKAEEEVQKQLTEKELILKEVHHRIKNNMNTVSSLLSLQASSMTEPTIITALSDARNRIQSMSVLYDKLYKSPDFTELSIKSYLSSLIDEVIVNFPNSQMVKIEKDIQDFFLDVKRIQLLAIIINELLTNIMKYAFIGKEHGLITVSASNIDGHVTIIVQDDGNGIPVSISFENSTGFGLQLVYALAQQLDGTIRIERVVGTKIILEFLI